jgi:hypothetical protein
LTDPVAHDAWWYAPAPSCLHARTIRMRPSAFYQWSLRAWRPAPLSRLVPARHPSPYPAPLLYCWWRLASAPTSVISQSAAAARSTRYPLICAPGSATVVPWSDHFLSERDVWMDGEACTRQGSDNGAPPAKLRGNDAGLPILPRVAQLHQMMAAMIRAWWSNPLPKTGKSSTGGYRTAADFTPVSCHCRWNW